MTMSANACRTAFHRHLARRLPLALAGTLLSVSAWAADGVLAFHGAIVVPPCNTQLSTGGTASVSCPRNGANAAEFADVRLLPASTATLQAARVSVTPVQSVHGPDRGSRQPRYIVTVDYN